MLLNTEKSGLTLQLFLSKLCALAVKLLKTLQIFVGPAIDKVVGFFNLIFGMAHGEGWEKVKAREVLGHSVEFSSQGSGAHYH